MSVEALIETLRTEHLLDRRSSVFEVHHITQKGTVTLLGHTTEDLVVQDLAIRVATLPDVQSVRDEVVRLPSGLPAQVQHAVIRSSVAPVYHDPRIPSAQITQLVLGSRVDLLSREGTWWRTRAEDGYIGWINTGYLAFGTAEWAQTWERGEHGDPVVSLGAELCDEEGTVFARLPWGARLLRYSRDVYALPDGRRGQLSSGEIVPVDRLFDRFPPRGDSVIRTARRWLGAPYLWGGVTMAGVDCSGLAQAVMWMHGVGLPRDSDLQGRVGGPLEPGDDLQNLKPGDLLFFAETPARISHVAISLGEAKIIHASLSNGLVAINDVLGEEELETRLRGMFVQARRVLPD